jgi:hypothetical protein
MVICIAMPITAARCTSLPSKAADLLAIGLLRVLI